MGDNWFSEKPFFEPDLIVIYKYDSKTDDGVGSGLYGYPKLCGAKIKSEFVSKIVWDCRKTISIMAKRNGRFP